MGLQMGGQSSPLLSMQPPTEPSGKPECFSLELPFDPWPGSMQDNVVLITRLCHTSPQTPPMGPVHECESHVRLAYQDIHTQTAASASDDIFHTALCFSHFSTLPSPLLPSSFSPAPFLLFSFLSSYTSFKIVLIYCIIHLYKIYNSVSLNIF